MAQSFEEAHNKASKQGADNLNLINNPFQNALISSYQAANLATNAPNPFMAALGGAAVGAQQLQQNQSQRIGQLPFEQNFPGLAKEFGLEGVPTEIARQELPKMILERQQQQGRMELLAPKTELAAAKEAGVAERFNISEANKTDRIKLKAQLTSDFNVDPDTAPRIMSDEEGREYLWNGKRWTPLTRGLERGNKEAINDMMSAISSLKNIDSFYSGIENSNIPMLAQQAGSKGVVGRALSFAYPEIAQKRASVTTLFTFATGGKALTENEQLMIDNLFSSMAYGPQQREAAKRNIKDYLSSKIKANISANLSGGAKEEIESMLNEAVGIPVKQKTQGKSQPKATQSDDLDSELNKAGL